MAPRWFLIIYRNSECEFVQRRISCADRSPRCASRRRSVRWSRSCARRERDAAGHHGDRGHRHRRGRLEREAQATARLVHPNIVTVFDFGAVGAEGAFIVMELVPGRSLRAELHQRVRVAPPDAAVWFEQICAGVATAHAHRVIHRDLKPENVLITRGAAGGDVAKVLDFGLAKLRPDDADETFELTNPGVVMGTAGYMSPEQLRGDDVDERGDIFALGIMVAEAIVGKRPFAGRTHSELLLAITNDPLTLDGKGSEVWRLEAVLQCATAEDPSARYRSVAEFARDVIPALRAVPPSVGSGNMMVT